MLHEVRKLTTNGRGFKLPIPPHFARALAWPRGTLIYMRLNSDDTITLRRVDTPNLDPNRHAIAA
jgi:hypothetical protein